MAISIQKSPLIFFNVFNPAVFEFVSTTDFGVNQNNVVADLEIVSMWTSRRYVIRNIYKNYTTGLFRIDVSSYLKALMLDNFEYRFLSVNKNFTIESYEINISIHPENAGGSIGDVYFFDSGYTFDDGFVFGYQGQEDYSSNIFFPIIGIATPESKGLEQMEPLDPAILAPKYIEVCEGFINTLSVFTPQKIDYRINVDGYLSAVFGNIGVSIAEFTDEQIESVYQFEPIKIQPVSKSEVYVISHKKVDCEKTLQLRFYNSFGGYSYFYSDSEPISSTRGKSDYINNDFHNPGFQNSPFKQRSVEYTSKMEVSGNKRIELSELFDELLRSPKVEVLFFGALNFRDCKITGQLNVRKLDFEYNLTIDMAADSQMGL